MSGRRRVRETWREKRKARERGGGESKREREKECVREREIMQERNQERGAQSKSKHTRQKHIINIISGGYD